MTTSPRPPLAAAIAAILLAAGPARPETETDAFCRQVWIAAYSIAWSYQVDGVGRMFWSTVAMGPPLATGDARKVWLSLRPLPAERIDALADAAYAEPRRPGREARVRAIRAFADGARDACLAER